MNRKALILIPAVLLVGSGVAWMTLRRAPESDIIELSGNIEVTQVEASFRVGGRVLECLTDEGQTVQEGQILARLEAQDLEQTVAIRQADHAVALAAYAELKSGSRREEIETARAAVDQAQAEVKRLEPEEARLRDLREKGIVSARDYEAVQAALATASAKVRQAEQQYTLAKKGPRVEDLEQGRAKSEQAAQSLALARTQLAYATLPAPLSGVVLSKNVEPREYVSPGTAVVTIGDLSNVWMRAYIEESDLGRAKVGQKARLTTDSHPGKTYEGRVSYLASEAEFTPKSVQTKKERVKLVYRIKIDVPNPAGELKPGMPVDATIQLQEGGR